MYFVTSNKHKVREALAILQGIEVEHYELELPEPRGSLEDIARYKASYAYNVIKAPLFVEDSGLFIDSLNGFPGQFSSFVNKTIGNKGILKLMDGIEDRRAYFKCALAYTNGKQTKVLVGVLEGRIAYEEKGANGFGYDPIFIPNGYSETLAENITLKNKTSHRYKSLLKFKKYLEGLNG